MKCSPLPFRCSPFSTRYNRRHFHDYRRKKQAQGKNGPTEFSQVKLQTFLLNWMRSRTPEGWVICLKRNTVAGSHKRFYGWLCRQQQPVLVFTFVWPCIVTNFFVIKPTRCTNLTNLFCHETLHISDSSSVHHQEFIHCTLSSGICHTGW